MFVCVCVSSEQGFPDLKEGIIRTPIDPMLTFDDDPLRVMRAVRFGSRYRFPLHADIIAAIQHPRIQVSGGCWQVIVPGASACVGCLFGIVGAGIVSAFV